VTDTDPAPHAHRAASRGALVFAIAANTVLLAAQVVVGLAIGSLALLSDSLHNASDVVALVIALAGQHLAARPATPRRSYGLARTEVLAALLNGTVLLALTAWVVVEAVERLGDAPTLDPLPLAIIGALGLVVNGGSAWYLDRAGDRSLNVRAAFWHLAADALGSLGVLVAAGAIAWFDAAWADPVASILISLLVLAGVWHLLRDTVALLLESTPSGIDPNEVAEVLAAVDGVQSAHHLHIWGIDSQHAALTAHLELEPGTDLHRAQEVADECRELLATRFRIGHATFEPECHDCTDPDHVAPALTPEPSTKPTSVPAP
jgi:cobalt-zinc-cadmium efflux system protein